MPELPEVESLRSKLSKNVLNKKIVQVFFDKKFNARQSDSQNKIRAALIGTNFSRIERSAKILIFKTANKSNLAIHLKMTGQLIFKNMRGKTLRGGHPMEEERFIKFSISFANGSTLLLNDPRRLAYVKILDENKLAALKKENGVDPLNNKFTFSMFKELLARRPDEKIKLALMNQSLIAGIGNMYANEICFAAKISPLRQNKKLTESEKKNLYAAIKKILAAATRLQMNDKEFDFKVYQRDGEKCRRCKGTVKRTVIDGRGTFFCPLCQK